MSRDLTPEYIPDEFCQPIDEQISRSTALAAERRNKLTPMQGLFVNHFFESNMDVSAAAKRTGITVGEAQKWIETEGPVSWLIADRLDQLSKSSQVTVEKIVEALWEEGTRMPIDSEDKTVSHAARVSALSHLAKFKGMFDKGNKGQGAKVTVNIDLGGGDDE